MQTSPDMEFSMNAPLLMAQFRKFGLGLILVCTCILAAILLFIINDYRKDTIKEASMEARVYNSLNHQYRRWGARIGSVYTPTDKVAPDPHLAVPDRDVNIDSVKSITPDNPAYMTRMVFDDIRKESKNPIISRLVSLNPLNPANKPNAWERETLRLFEKREVSERYQIFTIDELPYLQFMTAFNTEERCLKCHAHQGSKVGEVRGGISIAIPMSGYLAIEAERINSLVGGFALLWVLGTAGIAVSSNRRHQQEMKIIEKSVLLEAEIFERQRTQEQLEKQADMLEEEVAEHQKDEEELRKKNTEIEQFIYTVSHDLRSPLVTIKTFMGYLEKDMAEGNQEHLAQDGQFIHSAADKMKLLLDELLELSRIDRVEALPISVSLMEVLADVLDTLAGVINERKVYIQLPDTDLVLFGDRPRFCQIWQNLIENAIKYSSDGCIPRIELGIRQMSGETVFFVKDSGIGIDPQYQSKIFGIFEKLDPKSPGAGLGLSMIQRIVDKYGGRVWAESEGSDKGSCFFFTLPHAVVQS